MKIFTMSGPKGDPIEAPSIYLYILSLNVNAAFEHASFNNFFIVHFVKLVVTKFSLETRFRIISIVFANKFIT